MDQVVGTQLGYIPRRFWWTKRITIGSTVLVVLIVGLVFGATSASQRQLDAQIESYRAAGDPVYVEDFNVFKDIPDDENAATYYEKAELAYTWPAGIAAKVRLNDLHRASLNSTSNAFVSEIERLINTNGETIELLRKGGRCAGVEWGYTLTSPLYIAPLPSLSGCRDLGKLLGISAIQAHGGGHDDDALDLLISLKRLGDHRFEEPPALVGHMVALSITSLTCQAVEHIGHALVLGSNSDATQANTSVRRQATVLIEELLDESALAWSRSNTLAFERATLIDSVDQIGKGLAVGWYPTPPPPMSWLTRPLFIEHSREVAGITTAIKLAADMDTYSQAKKHFPDLNEFLNTGVSWLMPAHILMPPLERLIYLDFRIRADRRMAAVSLAIRLFEIDHGSRPQSLDELVPAYLDAIPLDPFAEKATPIQYVPSAIPPVLYSVGMDGVDEGGKYHLRRNGSLYPDRADLVYFLNGDRPKGKY